MFDTLLLAVDINDPEGSVPSTDAAVAMAKNHGSTLHILNVQPDDGMAIVSASLKKGHQDEAVKEAEAKLTAWTADHIPSGVPTALHVTTGTVYDQIIKTAAILDVNCIVVGAHRPDLKDYLIGPNAARVARHATQSVFVVR